jgi:hypothetical protein
MAPVVDNSAPDALRFPLNRGKGYQLQYERNQEIERRNKRLFEKMAHILGQKPRVLRDMEARNSSPTRSS